MSIDWGRMSRRHQTGGLIYTSHETVNGWCQRPRYSVKIRPDKPLQLSHHSARGSRSGRISRRGRFITSLARSLMAVDLEIRLVWSDSGKLYMRATARGKLEIADFHGILCQFASAFPVPSEP